MKPKVHEKNIRRNQMGDCEQNEKIIENNKEKRKSAFCQKVTALLCGMTANSI